MINTKKLCGVDLHTPYNGNYQKDVKHLKTFQMVACVTPLLIILGFVILEIVTNTNKTPTYYQTSFNCTKADNYVEKTICSNNELAQLDLKLLSTYKAKLAESKNKSTLKQQQATWVLNTKNNCSDIACITNVINSRIHVLNGK